MLILVFPYGLWLMWSKKPGWRRGIKWGVSCRASGVLGADHRGRSYDARASNIQPGFIGYGVSSEQTYLPRQPQGVLGPSHTPSGDCRSSTYASRPSKRSSDPMRRACVPHDC